MKYCLLAFSRTGSTALERCLCKHKCINHDMTRLPMVGDKNKWVTDFINRKDDMKWNGFKCLLYHYDEYLERDILSNSVITKIILLRKNLFEAALSKKIAERIGNWHTVVGYDNVDAFTIDEKWFSSYIDFVMKNINVWKTKSLNYKIFYYEDIFFNTIGYKPILDYLNIEEPIFPYSIEKSNDYSKIKSIIKNIDNIENIYREKKCLI